MTAGNLQVPIFQGLHPRSQFQKRCAGCAFTAVISGSFGQVTICLIDNLSLYEIPLTGLSAGRRYAKRSCAGYARRN